MQSVPDLAVGLWSLPTLGILLCSKATESAECSWLFLLGAGTALPTIISITTLFAMTVGRYFGVLHPLKHRIFITKKRVLIFCSCAAYFVLDDSVVLYAISLFRVVLADKFMAMVLFVPIFVAGFVYTRIFLVVKSRQPSGIGRQSSNVHGAEQSALTKRLIKNNILKQIRMAK